MVKGQRYAFATLVVTSATAPAMVASTLALAVLAEAPRLAGQVSGQSDLPSSITAASVSNGAVRHYGELR